MGMGTGRLSSLKYYLSQSKHLLCTLLALVLLVGCDGQSNDSQLDTIVKRGKLKVGTVFGSGNYYIGKEGPAGFEYELSKAFADYLNVELEIVPNYHISQLFAMLDANRVDILAGGLSITPQRLEKYRYSPYYYTVSQKLVFKQGVKRPRSFADLDGKLVVVAKSSHAETLAQYKQQYPELEWQETEEQDPDELLEMVVDGEIDYTITDSTTLAINRRYYPNLSIAFSLEQEQEVGWLIAKQDDDSLYSLMIEFFGQYRASGELTALEDKYFGHIEKFNYSDTKMFIAATDTKLPKYEHWFKQYAREYEIDWRLLAALSYQESLWNPRAKSHTGVRGIMMLTLPTARQVGVKSRLEPEQNIRGGAIYLSRLLSRIPERIQMPDRLWFAIASYNIGWGHLEDARVITQRQGGSPDKWIDVKKRLPLLRQKKYYKTTKYGYARGDEPVRYVENIRRYYDSLVWLDEKAQAEQKASEYREKVSSSLENQALEADKQAEQDDAATLDLQQDNDKGIQK